MSVFQPAINLLVLLSALSIAAERLANLVKLGHADLRQSRRWTSRATEKERERRIANRVLVASVLLAAAVRADFFAIVSHRPLPWLRLKVLARRPGHRVRRAGQLAPAHLAPGPAGG